MGQFTIPGPPGLPFVGNVNDVDPTDNLRSLKQLADQYGPIFRLNIVGHNLIVLCTQALVDETCDEKRFKKIPSNALIEIRHGVHDGLFTAYLEEPNWGIAHRILMPAFGPVGIRNMFDEMKDVAIQLALKWARYGPQHRILAPDDFTRLTLDTISLCSMGFRFNSFYAENLHPFVEAMGDFLVESGKRSQRIPLPSIFYRASNAKFHQDIETMRKTAEAVLRQRVSEPDNDRNDLLSTMLRGRDPKTGQKMSDESIIDNIITFLIAGHETTSGLLSYATHNMLKHPETYQAAKREIAEVIGDGPVTVQHMSKLPYISAIFRETLRLDSPISVFAVQPIEDTVLAGKYPVRKGDSMLNLLAKSHMDPAVFADPLEFRPERMLDENFNKLPRNAWKPFGNGVRACIGRAFAWQEALLAMAIILQNFELSFDDPDYKLEHKQTLTIKPDNLYIRARLIPGLDPVKLEQKLSGSTTGVAKQHLATRFPSAEETGLKNMAAEKDLKAITILYGSNSGTCQAMAQRLAYNAPAYGMKVAKLDCLDTATDDLPRSDDHLVVFITASYEGQPPDNAAKFVGWLEGLNRDDGSDNTALLQGVSYSVFGCGHHDWSKTFHRIPKLVDHKLEEHGASRVAEIGLADAADDDVVAIFEEWEDNVLWPSWGKKHPSTLGSARNRTTATANKLKVHISGDRASTLSRGLNEATVVDNRLLTAPGEPAKRHIELQLPAEFSYQPGDYLAVLPSNPMASVARAMRALKIQWDTIITIEGPATTIPTNVALYARTVLQDFVELGQPTTKRDIQRLAAAAGAAAEATALKKLAEDQTYAAEVAALRVSVLDLLERFPSVKLDIGDFLSMLNPLSPRKYSISSSPLPAPSKATLTVSALSEKAKSGNGTTYNGVASTYLSNLQPGSTLQVSVQKSRAGFHLPEDAENVPLILIAAGTGIAPFRGFIQERATLLEKSEKQTRLAPARLYAGCREAGRDDLYREELDTWEALGAVSVKRSFSRTVDDNRHNGHSASATRYVQDALWADREELKTLWKRGAKVYICGSRTMCKGVEQMAARMKGESRKNKGKGASMTVEQANEWVAGLRNVRYFTDVFD